MPDPVAFGSAWLPDVRWNESLLEVVEYAAAAQIPASHRQLGQALTRVGRSLIFAAAAATRPHIWTSASA